MLKQEHRLSPSMSHYEPTMPPQAQPVVSLNTQEQNEDKENEEDDPFASMKEDYKNAVDRLKKTEAEYASKLQQFEDEEDFDIKAIQAHWKAKKQALLQDCDEYTKKIKIEISFWKRKLKLF